MSSSATLSIFTLPQPDSYLFQIQQPEGAQGTATLSCHHNLPSSTVQLLNEQTEQTILLLNRLVEQRQAHSDHSQGDEEDPLRGLGRLLYNQVLPEAIQDALRQLPEGSALRLITNDRHIPWELSHDGEAYLALKYAVARQIVVEEMPRNQPASPILPQHRTILLIGNPTGDLPETAKEIEQLANLFDAVPGTTVQILMNRRATKQAILQRLASNRYDVIHYAGHATFDATAPTASGLLLAGEECLTATDITKHLNGSPFVFLNGCWSAQLQGHSGSPREGGEDIPYWGTAGQDLTSAFIQVGASGFIGSYWPVYDTSSRDFALVCYRHLLDGESVGAAVRRARHEGRQHNIHEPLWASYILYGNPQRPLWALRKAQRRPATVFVARLIGLEKLLNHADSGDAWDIVDNYLAAMIDIIERYRGEVHSIVHGTMLCTFGLVAAQQNDVEHALHAAWAMSNLLAKDRRKFEPSSSIPPVDSPTDALAVGIGISAGDLLMGNVQPNVHSKEQPHLSLMGDAILNAQQLAAQATHRDILISETVRRLARRFVHLDLQPLNAPDDVEGRRVYLVRKLVQPGQAVWPHMKQNMSGQLSRQHVTLVGRQEEMHFLQAAWKKCLRGQGQIVDINGSAGIGKSQLIYEFCHSLEADDVRTLWVACPSTYIPRPYWLVGQLVQILCNITAEESNEVAVEKLEQRLRQLPRSNGADRDLDRELALLSDTLSISDSQDSALEKDAAFHQQQLTTLLAYLLDLSPPSPMVQSSRQRPMPSPQILILEDLHWADEASLEIFNQLLKRIDRVPLLVLSSWRTDETEQQSPWQNHRRRQLLHVLPVSDDDCFQLLGDLLTLPSSNFSEHEETVDEGGKICRHQTHSHKELPHKLEDLESDPLDKIAQIVLPAADGNPFFLRELVTSLVESDALLLQKGIWQLARPLLTTDLPDTLRRVVWSRVESLPAAAQKILPLLSVVGDQLSIPLLHASSKGLRIDADLNDGLNQLEDKEFIYRHWHDDTYQFTHALLRSEVYSGIRSEERRRYHRRIGLALREIHDQREARVYAELAHHFYQSIITPRKLGGATTILPGAEEEHLTQAANYLVLAGRQANQVYAARQALVHFQRTLEVLEHLPIEAKEALPVVAYEGLGRAHNVLGEFEQAIASYKQAITAAITGAPIPNAQSKAADYNRRVGRLYGRLSRFDAAHQHMQQALDLLPSPQTSTEFDIVALTHTHTGSLYYLQGQYQQAERSCYQALELLESEVKNRVFATTANVLGAAYMAMGDGEKAVTWLEQSREIWNQVDDPYHLAQVTDNLGTLHYQRSEFTFAEKYYRQNLALWRQLEATDQIGYAELNLSSIHLIYGRLDEAERFLKSALTIFRQTKHQRLESLALNNLGLVELERQAYEQAKLYFTESMNLDVTPENLNGLSEANIGLGDLEAAFKLAQESLAQGEELALRFEQALALRTLGKIARRQLDWSKAEEHLHASLTLLRQIEARYEVARTIRELANLFEDMSRREEADRYRQEAQAILDEIMSDKGDFEG
ncbi:MAG: CHAT domain-containing protein [Chloroflexota bacterium]